MAPPVSRRNLPVALSLFGLLAAPGCGENTAGQVEHMRLPPPVQDLAVAASTDSSVTLAWETPTWDPSTDSYLVYRVRVYDQSHSDPFWRTRHEELASRLVPWIPVKPETVQVTGLKPGRSYRLGVEWGATSGAADDAVDWSPSIVEASATTR